MSRSHDSINELMSVAISDNGKYVAAGCDDGQVLLWELPIDQTSPQHKVMEKGGRDIVISLVFLPDATRLIASSLDKIWIWNTQTCKRISEATTKWPLHTLHINPSFPLYLMTGAGPVLMEDLTDRCSAQTKPTKWCPYSTASGDEHDESWITWMGKKVIFLPKQYRPMNGRTMQVRGHKVVIGCNSGQLLFFRFKEDASFSNGV